MEFIAGKSSLFCQNWEESSEPSVLDLFLTYQHSRNVLPIIGRQLNTSHMDDRSAPWTAQAAPERLWF